MRHALQCSPLLLLAIACGDEPGDSAGMIGPEGGTLELPGVARVEFPPGAFPAPTEVRIEQTADPVAAELYAETTAIFEPGPRAGYDVSVVTGDAVPVGTVAVTLFVPQELGPALFANVFVDALEASDLDTFEQFELIDSEDRDLDSITVAIDGERFAVLRRPGVHEAVLTVAGSNLEDEDGGFPAARTIEAAAGCGATKLLSPLKNLAVRSPFSLTRRVVVDGRVYIGHFGTDYIAADGDALYAVGGGKVVESYVSQSFGETMVISMPGNGAVRYAHMQTGSRLFQKGDTVCEGEKIGNSDNTGLSTGAHLHFEYAPNGQYGSNAAKVDPTTCIDTTRKASSLGGTWMGIAEMTTDIPFTGSNVGIEQTVTTTGAVLVPFEAETAPGEPKMKLCDVLVPRSGGVQLDRTETYDNGTQTCTVEITGSMQLTHMMMGPSSLSALPLPDGTVTYTAAMGDMMTLTHVDSCGSTTTGTQFVQWLQIPLVTDGSGPTVIDPDRLVGSARIDVPPDGTIDATWDFGR